MRTWKDYSKQMVSNSTACFNPDDYDWWCDECNASLDEQEGFFSTCGIWTCDVCGWINLIDENSDLEGNGTIDDGVSWDNDEPISIYDAANIWASHGKDEDYSFGFTEEELNDALNE